MGLECPEHVQTDRVCFLRLLSQQVCEACLLGMRRVSVHLHDDIRLIFASSFAEICSERVFAVRETLVA